ncbi:MAG: nucleotidyltransferase domain-containing protein [Caldilineaceae bacterium]
MQPTFSPEHSELETNPTKLQQYVDALEAAFGQAARVVGILEIGSFAKGEAVPTSDIDTRIYVTSPAAYLVNLSVTNDHGPPLYDDFVRLHPPLPRQEYTWWDFNETVMASVSTALPANIEFGFVDQRYAAYELTRLVDHPSFEHSILLQSNVLYDPTGFLQTARSQLQGRIFEPLVQHYTTQFLDNLSPRLYACLSPDSFDVFKLAKSGQIQWVQQAVRALRNAVAAKSYLATGHFLYKKSDVLAFYERYLPAEAPLVQELYQWKTDATVRAAMVEEFSHSPERLYARFREALPQVETIVKKVKGLTQVLFSANDGNQR